MSDDKEQRDGMLLPIPEGEGSDGDIDPGNTVLDSFAAAMARSVHKGRLTNLINSDKSILAKTVRDISDLNRIQNASMIPSVKALNESVINLTRPYAELITSIDAISRAPRAWLDSSWLSQLQSSPMALMQKQWATQLSQITLKTSFAESAIAALDATKLQTSFGIEVSQWARFSASINHFSSAYKSLFDFYENPIPSKYSDNPTLTDMPSDEAQLLGNVLVSDSVGTSSESEIDSQIVNLNAALADTIIVSLETNLNAIHLGFLDTWHGARAVLDSASPDRIRQSLTSIRELFTHLLHSLAPDSEVRQWSNDPDDYSDNRPTRNARLRYITRKLSHQPFDDLLLSDIRVTLEFFNFLNRGTHEIPTTIGLEQAKAIFFKMEGAIRFLIEIHRM